MRSFLLLRRLPLWPPFACRSLRLGIFARCGKILMANEPAGKLTTGQFRCPGCIAIRYQNFTTVAQAAHKGSAA